MTFYVTRNTPLSGNFRSESRINLDNRKPTIQCGATHWVKTLKSCTDSFVQHLPVYMLFLCLHTQFIIHCAVICGYKLILLMTTKDASISLFRPNKWNLVNSYSTSFLVTNSGYQGKWNAPQPSLYHALEAVAVRSIQRPNHYSAPNSCWQPWAPQIRIWRDYNTISLPCALLLIRQCQF